MNYQHLHEDPEYYSTVDDDFYYDEDDLEDGVINYDDLLDRDISGLLDDYYGA